MQSTVIDHWHALITKHDPGGLDQILADDVVFYSPIVHKPQEGKAITTLYLSAAFHVLVNETFSYVREVISERDAVLEFSVDIDGVTVNGVDMIRWNDEGKITEFKVMVRPLKAIQLVHRKMGEMLQAMGPGNQST